MTVGSHRLRQVTARDPSFRQKGELLLFNKGKIRSPKFVKNDRSVLSFSSVDMGNPVFKFVNPR